MYGTKNIFEYKNHIKASRQELYIFEITPFINLTMEQIDKWHNEILVKINNITNNTRDTNDYMKVCCKVSSGVYCSPCYTWSTLWRIIYCPFQCMFNEPVYMLSGNNCTKLSDSCIETCFESIDLTYGKIKTPFPHTEYKNDLHVKNKVQQVIHDTFQEMQDVADITQKYKMCDLLASIVRSINNNNQQYTLYPSITYSMFKLECNV